MKAFIPPYLVLILLAGLGALYALHPEGLPGMHQAGAPIGEVVIVAISALALLVGARVQFARADAEIMTFAEPRNLVTSGLFRLSRNPMYLGFTLLLIAAALWVNTWCALLAPAAFFLAAHFWYIPAEERAAKSAFGADYEDYARRTRRWI